MKLKTKLSKEVYPHIAGKRLVFVAPDRRCHPTTGACIISIKNCVAKADVPSNTVRQRYENTAVGDAQLMEGIIRGEEAPFTVLVRRHIKRFYSVAYQFTSNRTEAEDIVQEVFIKLWENPTLWRPDRNTSFTTWFYRMVINLCIDHRRKKRPLSLVDDTWVPDERETQEQEIIQLEKQQILETQIATLPERQRIALNLCFYEGMSHQETADIMGIHLKALGSLLMRAKSTLKERLTGWGD